jgi:hypothetical protein
MTVPLSIVPGVAGVGARRSELLRRGGAEALGPRGGAMDPLAEEL